jgi:hypothetical protein
MSDLHKWNIRRESDLIAISDRKNGAVVVGRISVEKQQNVNHRKDKKHPAGSKEPNAS